MEELFREASFSLPGFKIREIVEIFIAGDTNKDEKISFEEFVSVRDTHTNTHIYYTLLIVLSSLSVINTTET